MPIEDNPEPHVRRWPRAWRLMFLLAAAALCWAAVWLVLRLALGHPR